MHTLHDHSRGCQVYTMVKHVKWKDVVVTLLTLQRLTRCSAGQGVDPDTGSLSAEPP